MALLLLGGCASPAPERPDWVDGACLKHDDCRGDNLCVVGVCEPASADGPVALEDVAASQWFSDPDGFCSFDNECGPWLCVHDECVPPSTDDRQLPPLSAFRYWDTSCVAAADCGPWLCADGWCTQPGFVSPNATLATVTAPPGERSCLGDNECPENADCVYPGYCRANAADEPMSFTELGASAWYSNSDASCVNDNECGPHACVDGWCVSQEYGDRERPPRSNFFYYDASCSTDASCGTWVCADGFCQDPNHFDPSLALLDDGVETMAIGTIGGDGSQLWGAEFEDYRAEEELFAEMGGVVDGMGVVGLGSTLYCLSDDECPADADCVHPGECVDGAATETMTFVDLPLTFYATDSGACDTDADCGPHACERNVCIDQETAGRPRPLRSNFLYYDASCSTGADCGTWICDRGFCQDPAFHTP